MSKEFRGLGRYHEDAQGDSQWGFGYAGTADGGALDMGLGVYNSDKAKLLSATGRLGGWETDNGGFQIGAEGDITSASVQGGLLGDLASIFGYESEALNSGQGGWENFLGYELHGPQAKAEAHVGTEGLQVGAGADWFGGQGSIGGAEYDWFFGGTEVTVGGGVPMAPGASFGLHWSDDDQDGVRELGLNIGGDFAAGVGLGADVGIKTELFGHAYNWLFGDDESTN